MNTEVPIPGCGHRPLTRLDKRSSVLFCIRCAPVDSVAVSDLLREGETALRQIETARKLALCSLGEALTVADLNNARDSAKKAVDAACLQVLRRLQTRQAALYGEIDAMIDARIFAEERLKVLVLDAGTLLERYQGDTSTPAFDPAEAVASTRALLKKLKTVTIVSEAPAPAAQTTRKSSGLFLTAPKPSADVAAPATTVEVTVPELVHEMQQLADAVHRGLEISVYSENLNYAASIDFDINLRLTAEKLESIGPSGGTSKDARLRVKQRQDEHAAAAAAAASYRPASRFARSALLGRF